MSKYPRHTGPGSVSLRALIRDLIDYAGLFPPAALPMQQAVHNYAKYVRDDFWCATGVFVVPSSRLTEFEPCFAETGAKAWCLNALLGTELESDLRAIASFNTRFSHRALVCVVETKVNRAEDVQRIAKVIAPSLGTYYEIAASGNLDSMLRSIKSVNGRAKIRTGGVSTDSFPSSEDVAYFISECAKLDVPFKATAGLHHPVRCVKPLTYEPNAPTGTMHGFLNVFLAAVFAQKGGTVEQLIALLEDSDPSHFRFADDAAYWRDQRFTVDEIEDTREHFAISFGSCSFEEPIEDLKALNLL